MVNIALIGAGGIAGRHAEALAAIEKARIVAIVDVVQDKAERLAAACGATAYPSVEACLSRVDVAYVLTPPSTHCELVLKAIQALWAHVQDVADRMRSSLVKELTGPACAD